MGFLRQEYWSRLPYSPLEDLPDPGAEPASLTSPALADGFFTTRATWEAIFACSRSIIKPFEYGSVNKLEYGMEQNDWLASEPSWKLNSRLPMCKQQVPPQCLALLATALPLGCFAQTTHSHHQRGAFAPWEWDFPRERWWGRGLTPLEHHNMLRVLYLLSYLILNEPMNE